MNEADVVSALRAYWLSAPAKAIVDTAPGWLNLFDDDERPNSVVPYTVIRIASAGNERIGAGRRREENRGTIFVQVFSPQEGGPGPGERKAALVASAWRQARLARIILTAPSTATLLPEGGFNQQLITLGWRADLRFSDQGT